MTDHQYITERKKLIEELEDALTNHDDAWVNEVWRKLDEQDKARVIQPQLDEEYYDGWSD